MRIVVRSRGLAGGHATRAHAARRVRFALGRWMRRVDEVRVMIEDEDGPRGGRAIGCRIRARLRDGGELYVIDYARDALAAAGLAAQRLSRSAARHFDRDVDIRQTGRPTRAAVLGGVLT